MRLFRHRKGFSKRRQGGATDGYYRIVSQPRVAGEPILPNPKVVPYTLTGHNVLMTNFSTFTNKEILDLIDENYFTLGNTGREAVLALTDEMHNGLWEQHSVPAERMADILAEFTEMMLPYWDTPAMQAGARA